MHAVVDQATAPPTSPAPGPSPYGGASGGLEANTVLAMAGDEVTRGEARVAPLQIPSVPRALFASIGTRPLFSRLVPPRLLSGRRPYGI